MYVITYAYMQIKQSPLNMFPNRENNIAPKSHKDTQLKIEALLATRMRYS